MKVKAVGVLWHREGYGYGINYVTTYGRDGAWSTREAAETDCRRIWGVNKNEDIIDCTVEFKPRRGK